jgi:glycosyltransferase involved in cell wall biosynthesis
MTVPAVSVILATYRRQDLLPRAIGSVMAQTMPDWELVVVDDEPSPATEEIVASFADPRVRYVAHPENRGLCAARNTGIAAAKAAWIGFLDDDDEYLPHKLERQLAHAQSCGPGTGVISCYEEVLKADGSSIVRAVDLVGDVHRRLVRDDLIRMQPLLVRRACFDIVGLFDVRLRMHDDFDMTLRLSRAFSFDTVREPLVRIHAAEHLMSTNSIARLEALQVMLTAHPELREDRRLRSRWLRRVARHHAEKGDLAEWRRATNQALRADPLSPTAWLTRFGGPGWQRRLARARGRYGRAVRRMVVS